MQELKTKIFRSLSERLVLYDTDRPPAHKDTLEPRHDRIFHESLSLVDVVKHVQSCKIAAQYSQGHCYYTFTQLSASKAFRIKRSVIL